MKKVFFVSLLGLLLIGCTKEAGKNPGPDEAGATNYLSVSLVAANRAGTRVDINGDKEEDFEDGSKEENAVSRIRFYFFGEKGAAFPVWKGTGSATASYIDWYPTAADFKDGESETVEKIANTTLSLNLTSEGGKPASVLAVINPCASVLALEGNPNLETLRKAIYDFNTGLTDKNFVMSNSVYVEGDGTTVYSTALESDNFATTLEAAQDHKVKIYVERVVARLDLTVDKKLQEQENKDLTEKVGSPVYSVSKDYTIDGETSQEVFVQFLGWNVTSTPDKSYLVKEIDPTWKSEDLFGDESNEIWNTDNYHRSFWAVNPPAEKFKYQYGTFTKGSKDEKGKPLEDNHFPADALKIPADGPVPPVYLHENAGAAGEEDQPQPTKVIIAARLLNEKGEALELAEWAYRKYTLENLKTVFANEVLRLYKKDGASYKSIDPEELDFKTAQDLETGESSYYVYAVLASGVDKDGYWYLKVDGVEGDESDKVETNFTPLTSQQANDYLRDRINHVMVWKGGNTYYYLNIRHLGDDESKPGYWGVVRNHLYKVNISKLEGLGTPVYDPDEVIHPEQPEGDDSIISAEVKILQWRIVSQDYDLTWK